MTSGVERPRLPEGHEECNALCRDGVHALLVHGTKPHATPEVLMPIAQRKFDAECPGWTVLDMRYAAEAPTLTREEAIYHYEQFSRRPWLNQHPYLLFIRPSDTLSEASRA